MKVKEKLEIGRIVGIVCLILLLAAIIIPLINNFLKGNIKIIKNDMRVDYAIDEESVALNITGKSANSFRCYYGLDENNLIELDVSNNTCKISTDDLIAGQTYYYKIIAYDNNNDKLFEKTFEKNYNAKLKTILKDKCTNLGYCNDEEIIYIKDDNTLYALYKKDEENNTVIGLTINSFVSYNLEENINDFGPSSLIEFLGNYFEERTINKYLIDYEFEIDVIEKGKLSNEEFHKSKINLLSWFDYENIKNYDYFKYVTTILGSRELEKRKKEVHYYPIYVTGKDSKILKNIKSGIVALAPIIALPLDLEINNGFGTIDEPFILAIN